jgi:hypothetical protein
MATVLETNTIEEQRSVVRFLLFIFLQWERFFAQSSSQLGQEILSRTF